MKILFLILTLTLAAVSLTAAQTSPLDSLAAKATKDSLKHVKMVEDSLHMAKLFAVAQYPLMKGTKWSGVIPVEHPTEVPDPDKEYKLLFEFTAKNPDSTSKEINECLDEVARIVNLHYASGIPVKNIIPVIVIHGPGLETVKTDEAYNKRHKIDNPNLKLVADLEKVGAKFIACGQAMAYFKVDKSDLLPEVKITLTAQTVLSNYQSQGYTLYRIEPGK